MGLKEEALPQVRYLPLLWLSIAFLLGILLAAEVAAPLWAWLASAALAAGLLALPGRMPRLRRRLERPGLYSLAVLALAVFFLGAARYQVTQSPPDISQLAHYNDAPGRVTVMAVVSRPPIPHDSYVEYRLEAEQVTVPGEAPQSIRGGLLAQLSLGSDWDYGDRLRLTGELETPSEGESFSYRAYLARYGVHSLISFPQVEAEGSGAGNFLLAGLYGLRERSLETIQRLYREPEASLLAGILLGDESGLSEPLKAAFNDTGARHIIAISGFNITIIAGFVLGAFRRWLGARRGAWLAALAIGAYTLLVGADAAVVRAAIMGGLALLARQVGSRQVGLNTLAFTAALMALANPLLVWDVGFQLSVAATLGLILYADRLTAWAEGLLARRFPAEWVQRVSRPVSEYLLFSLAAQATTLPLLIYYFQRFSMVSLPVNLLILPAQPALMMLGGLSVLVGLFWLPGGSLLALAAWPFAAFTIRIVQLAASLPGAALAIAPLDFGWVLLYLLVLVLITHRQFWPSFSWPRLQPGLRFAALGVVTLWLWSAALARPDGMLTLTLLDTNGGEAVLLHTPTGRNLLINGGASPTRLSEELGRALPAQGRRLDWLVVAAVQQRNLAALVPNVERLAPEQLAWTGSPSASFAARQVSATLAELGREPASLSVGQRFELGDGARLEVVTSGSRGAVLLLSYRDFRALLPFGLDFDDLETLDNGRSIGRVDVLLLADGGFAPLNPPNWLHNLAPRLVLLSVAAGNPDGLPAPEVIEALDGYTVLRSDQDGWVRLVTDGQRLWVESGR